MTWKYELIDYILQCCWSAMTSAGGSELLMLAQKIGDLTSSIKTHLSALDHPEPNFTPTSQSVPSDLDYISLRNSLNDAASDLLQLVNGPQQHFRKFICTHHELAAHQVAFEYKLFSAVSENEGMSLSDLSTKVGLETDLVGRVMRLLCTKRVFKEEEKDVFAHTSMSVIFRRDTQLSAVAEYQLDEMFKAASDTVTGIREGKPPFEQRHGDSLFGFYAKHPKLAARFAEAMAGATRMDRQVDELELGYPWSEMNGGTVVDVGGGNGHVSLKLARLYPKLKFIVQDNDFEMLAQAQKQDISDVESRVKFMQHDFFQPQSVTDADVYFIRQCLLNWDDDHCVTILKALVPALERKPGTPLLINDTILPEPGTRTRYEENSARQVDMLMFVALGAKQRTEDELRRLFEFADRRFRVRPVRKKISYSSLILWYTGCESP
jgi:SAM-dependent methyltransferase